VWESQEKFDEVRNETTSIEDEDKDDDEGKDEEADEERERRRWLIEKRRQTEVCRENEVVVLITVFIPRASKSHRR
jgi:hypothetical protein